MQGWRGRMAMVVAALAVAGGAMLFTSNAAAQGEPGGFSGVPPVQGGVAFLTTTGSTDPAALAATLEDAGCAIESIVVHAGQTWSTYIPGAPVNVNASFPSTVDARTPFFVRCRDTGTPSVDPANATYGIDSSDVTLVDGRSEEPVAPGSATMTVTELIERQSYGDLDRAGAADAAVVLTQDPGGSGTFYYLSAVAASSTSTAPTVLLGDRVAIEDVAVAHGRITVSYLVRRAGEPFTTAPSVPVTRSFVFEGGALIELGSTACEASGPDDVGSFVFVAAPHPGAFVTSGFDVTGCSQTFESTVNWRLLDREGTEVASGFTMGGGVDGPGRFSFTVEYSVSEQQLGHLEVFEVDASGGEGFPPPRNVVPVVLGP